MYDAMDSDDTTKRRRRSTSRESRKGDPDRQRRSGFSCAFHGISQVDTDAGSVRHVADAASVGVFPQLFPPSKSATGLPARGRNDRFANGRAILVRLTLRCMIAGWGNTDLRSSTLIKTRERDAPRCFCAWISEDEWRSVFPKMNCCAHW